MRIDDLEPSMATTFVLDGHVADDITHMGQERRRGIPGLVTGITCSGQRIAHEVFRVGQALRPGHPAGQTKEAQTDPDIRHLGCNSS